jgi:sugar/nucleoside kinase (ribokinase family)
MTNSNEESKSDLEIEFQAAYDKALPLINLHIKEAKEAIAKAIEIANQYGIPFSAAVSPLRNGYVPRSFESKFSELDSEIVSEISGVYDPNGDALYEGWIHSAVC